MAGISITGSLLHNFRQGRGGGGNGGWKFQIASAPSTPINSVCTCSATGQGKRLDITNPSHGHNNKQCQQARTTPHLPTFQR